MNAKPILWTLFPILAILIACTESYSPDLAELDRLVVADGFVTNGPGPYTVKLAYSGVPYFPISDAQVYIVEDDGDRHQLIEREPGIYLTDSLRFRARRGRSYKLLFELDGNRRYESPFKEILDNPGIDTVTAAEEWRYFDELQKEIPGYQFYVTTKPAPNRDYFFLWRMEGTYQYTADFLASYYFAGSLVRIYNSYEYYTCWRTYLLSQMAAGDTRTLQTKQIVGRPLTFIKGNNKKLSHRFSLLTQQLSVDKETYDFWSAVISMGFSSSTLYSTQPYLIKGNVSNIQDPEEVVLGYFTVGGVDEMRVFTNRPIEFPVTYPPCQYDYDNLPLIYFLPPSEWPIFITLDPEGRRAISNPGCIDCRELGGKLSPPDWWE